QALSAPCPEALNPSIVYSVDLTYRFLPDVLRLARAASPNDPLVEILRGWGRDWPLSSVGIANLNQLDPTSFISDRCLRQLYVDRILREDDVSRLDDPKTRQAVLAAIGKHSKLSPKLVAHLADIVPGENKS